MAFAENIKIATYVLNLLMSPIFMYLNNEYSNLYTHIHTMPISQTLLCALLPCLQIDIVHKSITSLRKLTQIISSFLY